MPLYPGFDIATFVCLYSSGIGKIWSNTFYWQAASTNLDGSNISAGAQAFHTQWGAVVKNVMHESCALQQTTVRVFYSGGIHDGGYAQTITGTIADGDALPLQDTLIIKKKTGQFGRSAMGRYFLSGLGEEMQTDGRITSSTARAAAKAVADFLGADRTFTVPFHARHWNRKLNTFIPITRCLAQEFLKSRRDRQETEGNISIG